MIRGDNFSQIFRIEIDGEFRRTVEIAEHHRQLSPLGCRRGCAIRERRDHSRFAAFV